MNTNDSSDMMFGNNKSIVIESSRIEECMLQYRQDDYKGVIINRLCGYSANDIEFLKDHPYIEGVALVCMENVDLSPLYELHGLRWISNGGNVQPLDLGRFTKLTSAWMEWHPKLMITDVCTSIRTLALHKYRPKHKDISELANLPHLEDLSIIQSPIVAIDGIQRYGMLRRLELSYLSKLERLGAIRELHAANLELLECEMCKRIKDHGEVRVLASLRRLRFNACGDMASIAFLKDLENLEDFRFVESNVVDGDLSPLHRFG
jgi:protein phosphatase 1 regulatory subunit 7